MTAATPDPGWSLNGEKTVLAASGGIAALFGLLVLFWPTRTALIVTALIAAYALVMGLVYAWRALFTKTRTGWSRVGHGFLGILFVVAGVLAFANIRATALWLAVFLGVSVGILWIIEGFVALSTLADSRSRGWTLVFVIVSIIAGIVLLFAPVWGAAALWWILGVCLVAIGAANLVRALAPGPDPDGTARP